MIIGLSIAFQQNFLTWSGRWSSASFAIPTIILFLALLFLPQARIEGRRITSTVTPRVPSMRRATGGMLVLFGFMLINAMIWERIGIRNLTLVVLIAFPMLSLVPLTGWSGQISLAQITFVGVGRVGVHRVLELGRPGLRRRPLQQREPVGSAGRGGGRDTHRVTHGACRPCVSKVSTSRWPRWRSRAWPSS